MTRKRGDGLTQDAKLPTLGIGELLMWGQPPSRACPERGRRVRSSEARLVFFAIATKLIQYPTLALRALHKRK